MIFHPNGGIIEKTGTFTTADGTSVNLGFVPDVVWITGGESEEDSDDNEILYGAGGNFKGSGHSHLLIGMWGNSDSDNYPFYVQDVYLSQTNNGFKVRFVTYDTSFNVTDSPRKTYTYHAMKYS